MQRIDLLALYRIANGGGLISQISLLTVGSGRAVNTRPNKFFRVGLRCFIRELLLTFSLSSTTCNSAWVSRGFSVIKHV